MQDVLTLPVAIAAGGLGITVFAIVRRLMRVENPPRWLATDITAYVLALLFTAFLALSLMGTAFALSTFISGAGPAGIASVVLHIAYWMIARLIIPIRAPGHGDMPPKGKVA